MSSKPRCVLHVGTMKTGTSTIQAWLGENRDALARAGWIYPGWPCRDSRQIATIAAQIGKCQNLIISDEGLWHFSGQRSKTDEIADALKGFDVTVIVYFRRPDQFLEAWFKQGLKSGLGAQRVPSFLRSSLTSAKRFKRHLGTFVTLFGKENVRIAPYELSQWKNGKILDDFLVRADLPQQFSALPVPLDRNISPSAEVMLLAGIMRSAYDCDKSMIDQLLNLSPDDAVDKAKTSILTPEEAARIRRAYRPLFRHIQKKFQTGVEPDFFRDWGDGKTPVPVSPLRDAYDRLVSAADDATRRGKSVSTAAAPSFPQAIVRRGLKKLFR